MKIKKIMASVMLMEQVQGVGMPSVQAASVSQNSRPSTPVWSDFSTQLAAHAKTVGYGENNQHGMFLATFHGPCSRGQQVVADKFNIQVRKQTQGPNRGGNDALAFWDHGTGVFNTCLGSANDAPGSTQNLSLDWHALPPLGNGVITSLGHGLGSLNEGDFSFSVQDDTSVLSVARDCQGGQVMTDGGTVSAGGGLGWGDAMGAGSAAGRKGMTWGLYPPHPDSGMATVACQGPAGRPLPCPPGGHPAHVGAAGAVHEAQRLGPPRRQHARTAELVRPCDRHHACGGAVQRPFGPPRAGQFGPNGVVADVHAGSGWKLGAYGNGGQPGQSRFWVNINDQPAATCWTP